MAKKKGPRPFTRLRRKRTRQLTNSKAVERIRGFTREKLPLDEYTAKNYLLAMLAKVRRKFSRKPADRWAASLFIRWSDEGAVYTMSRVAIDPYSAIEKVSAAVSEPGPSKKSDDPLERWIIGFRFDKYVDRAVKRKIYKKKKAKKKIARKKRGAVSKATGKKKKRHTRRVRHRKQQRKK